MFGVGANQQDSRPPTSQYLQLRVDNPPTRTKRNAMRETAAALARSLKPNAAQERSVSATAVGWCAILMQFYC